MKFAIVFACALAVASAGHLVAPLAYHNYYHGPQHLPIIGHDGVPVDTAEVQHARAAHYVHKAHAYARDGDYHYDGHHYDGHHYDGHHYDGHYAHHAPVVAAYAAHHVAPAYHHTPAAYPTTAVLPASVNGVPLDTPEVAAAKAHHFAAHHEAVARNAHHHLYRKRRGIYAAPLAYSHYAAPLAYYGAHYHGPQHLPIIGHDGVPVDTAEVQHARAAHYVHKAHAQARNGDYHAHHAYAPWAHYY